MSATSKAADAYSLFEGQENTNLRKADQGEHRRGYAVGRPDETRNPRDAGDRWARRLGTSLTSHPYFTYHKAHLEALGMALNGSSNLDSAQEALNRAVQSADAAASLTKAVANYTSYSPSRPRSSRPTPRRRSPPASRRRRGARSSWPAASTQPSSAASSCASATSSSTAASRQGSASFAASWLPQK